MAVEILILSGGRRNERIVLDCRAFRVGCQPGCDVLFDPHRDPAAQGRSARFFLQDGGWYVRSSGGEMWIGKQRIAGTTHVRSGDVIRLSAAGPRLLHCDCCRGENAAGQRPRRPGRLASGSGRTAAADRGNGRPLHARTKSADPDNPPPPRPIVSQRSQRRPSQEPKQRQSLIWIASGLLVGILMLLALRAVFVPSPPIVVNVNASGGQPTAFPIAAGGEEEDPRRDEAGLTARRTARARAVSRAATSRKLARSHHLDARPPRAAQ